MSSKKTTGAAKAASQSQAKMAENAETVAKTGQETVEGVVKAGSEAAAKQYEQAVTLTKEQVEKTSSAVFQGYDADGNGHLDPMEFRKCLNETQILGRPLDPKEVQSIMVGIDENEDGRIDYEEFINFMLEIMEYYYREQRMSEM